ncbi:MAG: nucleotidyl transferase AbiEii/AbiGii toxin family protein [Deltaproteobacteria bacterium]|nr:nucleotidyl transferase AbiEii/AbiGii toxin family protein [Deltaproteobacteria bacterium]
MRDLIQQEIFELETLDRLNSCRVLPCLVFGGGTMLRLCHGLERFSVDLDFWLKGTPPPDLFMRIQSCLDRVYTLSDVADKFHTWLFEIKSSLYPRSLKLEIRKDMEAFATEQTIAYSRYTSMQVLVTSVSLADMAASKIKAFLQRREIRDAYDLEFLYKRGVFPDISPADRESLIAGIEALTQQDYQVKLGSLLEEPYRSYYRQENFKILKSALKLKN